MAVKASLEDGSEVAVPEAAGGASGEAETLLVLLAANATGRARRAHALPRGATNLALLAKLAGIDHAELEVLGRTSTGIYTEEDYLAQFSEDWERTEYGGFARETVAKNLAAWQPVGGYRRALEQAMRALADPKTAALVLPSHAAGEASAILARLHARVASATTEVCIEIDDLD